MNAFETDLTNQGISTNAESIASERPEFKKENSSSPFSSITWGFRIVLALTAFFLATTIVLGISAIGYASSINSQYAEREVEEIKRIAEHPGVEFSKFISECRSEEATVDRLENDWSSVYYHFQNSGIDAPWTEIKRLAIEIGFFYSDNIPVYDQNGNWVRYTYEMKVDTEKASLLEQALLEDLDKLAHNLELYLSDSNCAQSPSSVFQMEVTLWGDSAPQIIQRMHSNRWDARFYGIFASIFLAIGIVGIFVSKILHGKLKEQQRAAEELRNARFLAKIEEMQRKIDVLEGRAPTQADSDSAVQTHYQELSLPASVQRPSPSMTGSYMQTDIDQSLLARPKSKMEKLLKTLDERQENAEGVGKIFLAVIFFPLRLVLKTLTLRTMRAAFIEADKISKETAARHEVGGYAEAKHRKAQEKYRRLNTNEEKMLFFYRHFAAVKSCSKPTTYAYIMTYLAEHSQLFDKNDPLRLASCFTDNVDHALCSLIGLDPKTSPDDRQYEQLLRRSDKELASDKYVLQCLLIAANSKEDGTVPFYRYGILDRENASKQTAQEF